MVNMPCLAVVSMLFGDGSQLIYCICCCWDQHRIDVSASFVKVEVAVGTCMAVSVTGIKLILTF